MLRINKIKSIKDALAPLRKQGKTIGFVPTMGYLHDGHLSLMRKARSENDFVVVSIFVNPIQFGPKEDLKRYPRDIKRDIALAKEVGVDLLFTPSVSEMYPEGFKTFVEVTELQDVLCGYYRRGHFRGVCTVVLKLFNIIQPNVTYFGQKDLQQAIIIKQMAKDLDLGVSIKILPIVREKDGLAMSSRNVYLKPKERAAAPVIYHALTEARRKIYEGVSVASVIKTAKTRIASAGGDVQYLKFVDLRDLKEKKSFSPKDKSRCALAAAVYFGKTRLIDNVIV